MKYYIINHKPLEWPIPFEHIEIGVGGYTPANGMSAEKYCGRIIDSGSSHGSNRANRAIMASLLDLDPREDTFVGSYRLFMGTSYADDWLTPVAEENIRTIISAKYLQEHYRDVVALSIPAGYDIMVCHPVAFQTSILENYAQAHHLDDLMFGVGCAIRAGLIRGSTAAYMLPRPFLFPFGYFASTASFRYDLSDRLQWSVDDFYRRYWIPRDDYQSRSLDFVFERIVSMALFEIMVDKKMRVCASKPVLISDDGVYKRSV